jgi:sulfoxide reductase heme-binding subunit YedZ
MSSPVLWYATRATGLVSLVLLTVTMVLGVLTATRMSGRWWPRFATQDLHRRVSSTSLVFLAGHILASILDTWVHIGWIAVVVPFASGYRRVGIGLGAIAVELLLAVAISSVLRHRIRARTWRALHWLAYASWPVAAIHGFTMGTDMRLGWVTALTLGCVAVVTAAGAWRATRLVAARRLAATVPAVRERPRGVPIKHLVHR